MPSIINPPSGCKFHTRCPYYDEKCEKEEPELRVYKGGYVACHYAEKVEKEREKKMKISHVRGKNISNMGYSCRFNFGKFLLV